MAVLLKVTRENRSLLQSFTYNFPYIVYVESYARILIILIHFFLKGTPWKVVYLLKTILEEWVSQADRRTDRQMDGHNYVRKYKTVCKICLHAHSFVDA